MTNQELFALIKKNPIGFGCGLLSLALVAGIYFRSEEIPSAEAELQTRTDESDRYSANLKNADKLKEQYETAVAATKEINARLVHAGEFGVNYALFYKLENELGVKVTEYVPTTSPGAKLPAKATYLPVSFRYSVQGDLAQVMQVLRIFESGAHYCRVLTATCTVNNQARSGPVTLALTLELLGLP